MSRRGSGKLPPSFQELRMTFSVPAFGEGTAEERSRHYEKMQRRYDRIEALPGVVGLDESGIGCGWLVVESDLDTLEGLRALHKRVLRMMNRKFKTK